MKSLATFVSTNMFVFGLLQGANTRSSNYMYHLTRLHVCRFQVKAGRFYHVYSVLYQQFLLPILHLRLIHPSKETSVGWAFWQSKQSSLVSLHWWFSVFLLLKEICSLESPLDPAWPWVALLHPKYPASLILPLWGDWPWLKQLRALRFRCYTTAWHFASFNLQGEFSLRICIVPHLWLQSPALSWTKSLRR